MLSEEAFQPSVSSPPLVVLTTWKLAGGVGAIVSARVAARAGMADTCTASAASTSVITTARTVGRETERAMSASLVVDTRPTLGGDRTQHRWGTRDGSGLEGQ